MKEFIDNNNYETMGAHIRNMLGHYANIVQMLSDIHKFKGQKEETLVKDYLLNKIDPKELKDNLNHLIELSKMNELESINWRATELYREYEDSKV